MKSLIRENKFKKCLMDDAECKVISRVAKERGCKKNIGASTLTMLLTFCTLVAIHNCQEVNFTGDHGTCVTTTVKDLRIG